MSPEQLRGGTIQSAWDIWALSVVVYEMLTGAHPFAAETVEESHSAVLAGRFAPLDARLPDAPRHAGTFFERAFAAAAAQRPPSGQALLGDLARAFGLAARGPGSE